MDAIRTEPRSTMTPSQRRGLAMATGADRRAREANAAAMQGRGHRPTEEDAPGECVTPGAWRGLKNACLLMIGIGCLIVVALKVL